MQQSLQSKSHTMHSPYTTQTGHFQGGSYSGQWVAMVIMDKEDYTNKAQALLQDTNTYKVLKKDPNSYLKKQTHHPTQRHKTNRKPQHQQVQTTISHQCSPPPKFYGLPKIHKVDTPLRPIVSSRGPSHMV